MYRCTGAFISCDEASEAFAIDELRPLFATFPPLKWLDTGVALLETEIEYDQFAAQLDTSGSVFIRHIAPVQRRAPLTGSLDDLLTLKNEARQLANGIVPDQTFAVQSRILGDGKRPYRRVTINETLSDLLHDISGAELDTRKPVQVVSVVCTPTEAYMGASPGALNRSLWPGGAHRFQRESGQISRAEFKLLEAQSLFQMAFPSQGLALDMGAAPGGWTRVLRGYGLQVVAVDPADLDSSLQHDRGVKHIRRTIQSYLPNAPQFDVVVNDMRMDPLESVELMLQARSNLSENGLALLTLKLPEEIRAARGNPELVRKSLNRLTPTYRLIGARQLYHNRSEVTVALAAS